MSIDIRLSNFAPEGLTPQQEAAAHSVLGEYGAVEFTGYTVRWPDNTGLAFYGATKLGVRAPFSGLLNPLGGLSHRFCEFTFAFSVATRSLIRPDLFPPATLFPHPAFLEHFPDNLIATQRIRVTNADALLQALSTLYSSR